MMTTKEHAAEIRKALKARGWNARKVSVRMDLYSMGSSIDVSVKDLAVPLSEVRAVAMPHQHVDRCEASGEILSGANMFVRVDYSDDAIRPLRRQVEAAIGEQCDPDPGALATILGCQVWRCTHERDYLWIVAPGEDHGRKVWGVEHAARQIAEIAADGALCDRCGTLARKSSLRGKAHAVASPNGIQRCGTFAAVEVTR